MIVKLVRAVVEETGRGSPDASTWLQMGEEYVVLSVDVTWRDVNNNWIDLQIHNPDEASPYDWGYWSIHHFEVTSPRPVDQAHHVARARASQAILDVYATPFALGASLRGLDVAEERVPSKFIERKEASWSEQLGRSST